jgi:hypothetical protein
MSYLSEPHELTDVEALRLWTLNRLRNRREADARFLLIPDPDGRAGRLDGKDLTGRRLAQPLFGKLLAKWPVSTRTGGRTHLGAAGVYDLVGHSGPLKKEALRLRALDDAWAERRRRITDEAESVFDRLEGIHAARDRARREHPPYYCTIDCAAPLCAALAAANRRACHKQHAWLNTPAAALGGKSPLEIAGDGDEGLARALFYLQGLEVAAEDVHTVPLRGR